MGGKMNTQCILIFTFFDDLTKCLGQQKIKLKYIVYSSYHPRSERAEGEERY